MINNTKMLYAEKIGIEKGIKQGVKDYKKELVLNMIKQANLDYKEISRLTNITVEEIKSIVNEQ